MISHLPVHLVGPGFVVVEGHASGERVRVLIDTGDFAPYPVLITPALAARLRLRPRAAPSCLHGSLGGGPVCFTPVSLSLRVGVLAALGNRAAISPQVGQIASRFGGRFEAVIGGEFLKAHRITIDYRHRLATIDGRLPNGPSTAFKPLRAAAVVAEAKVNGAASLRFLVDTAAADTIASPSIAGSAQLAARAPARLYGAGGGVSGALSDGNRICIALRCRSGMTVKIAPLPSKIDLLGTSIDGVLGVGFLAASKLTIDYPNHRLWLEP